MKTDHRPSFSPYALDGTLGAWTSATRRWVVGVGAASLLATLVAGCTILKPIQPPTSGGFFPPEPVVSENLPACGSSSMAAHCYVGGLGEAIQTVDERRLQLAGWAADVANTNSAFNALLWPLSAALLVNAQTASDSSLLKSMAALGAGYGFLSAGVPERQEYYLQASHRLFCAILDSRPNLYRTWDYDHGPVRALNHLRRQLWHFSDTRVRVLRELHPRPSTVRTLPDTVPERRLAELEGKQGGYPRVRQFAGQDHGTFVPATPRRSSDLRQGPRVA